MARLNVKVRMTMKETDRKGTVCDGVNWIHQGQKRGKWWTLVKEALKLLSPVLD
jgi:hypothetical protein